MATIFDDIKYRMGNAPILKQLIYTNVGVFIAVHLAVVVLMLFNVTSHEWLSFLEVPSRLSAWPYRFWTIFTYMFVHYDVWHLLFNMLWLYWFGSIFIQYFSQKHLSVLYIVGGLAGAALYLLSYNVFPYFADKQGMMCGASAAIMAIVFATAIRVPDYKVNLMFVGAVSLKYIAAVVIIIDLLSMTSPNAGGHFAHIGGALMGAIFALCWNRGKDILSPVNNLMDRIVSGWGRPKIRFKHAPSPKKKSAPKNTQSPNDAERKRPETDGEYRMRKKQEAEEIDRILDKIKKSGYSALTTEEKQRLFDVRKK